MGGRGLQVNEYAIDCGRPGLQINDCSIALGGRSSKSVIVQLIWEVGTQNQLICNGIGRPRLQINEHSIDFAKGGRGSKSMNIQLIWEAAAPNQRIRQSYIHGCGSVCCREWRSTLWHLLCSSIVRCKILYPGLRRPGLYLWKVELPGVASRTW